jgi:hypothetical protein
MKMKILLLVLQLLLVGCAGVYRYDTQDVTAYGGKLGTGNEPLYYSLAVDFEKGNGDIATVLAIKFAATDAPVTLDELTPEEAARHLPPWEPPKQWPEGVKQREKNRLKGYQVYSGKGAYLSFREGKLAYLAFCSHCEGKRFQPPLIGRAGSDTAYSLPLTENQLRAIFGTPTRLKRQREIYY